MDLNESESQLFFFFPSCHLSFIYKYPFMDINQWPSRCSAGSYSWLKRESVVMLS